MLTEVGSGDNESEAGTVQRKLSAQACHGFLGAGIYPARRYGSLASLPPRPFLSHLLLGSLSWFLCHCPDAKITGQKQLTGDSFRLTVLEGYSTQRHRRHSSSSGSMVVSTLRYQGVKKQGQIIKVFPTPTSMTHFLQGNSLLRIPEPSQIAPPAVDVQTNGSMKYILQPNYSTALFFNIKALRFLPLRKAFSTVGQIVHPPGKTHSLDCEF